MKAGSGLATGWKLAIVAVAVGAAASLAAAARYEVASTTSTTSTWSTTSTTRRREADEQRAAAIAPVAPSPKDPSTATGPAGDPAVGTGAAEAPRVSPPVADASAAAPASVAAPSPPLHTARGARARSEEAIPTAVPGAPPNAPPNAPPSHAPSAVLAASEPPAAPSAGPDTLVAETRRLREAHAALQGGDGARALALLEEQSAGGPQLREERAAGRILALCSLGRTDEARAAASRFLAESPRSPLAGRVRASCAGR
jgi:hypothetical protein